MMFFSSFGSFGRRRNFEFLLDGFHPAFQLVQFVLRVGAHVGVFFVGQHGFAVGDAFGQVLIFAIFIDDGRDFSMRFGSLLVSRRVVHDIGRGESVSQLFVAEFDLVEAFKHGSCRSFVFSRSSLASCFRPLSLAAS